MRGTVLYRASSCIGINTGFIIKGGNQEEWKRGRGRVGREDKEKVFVNLFI